MATGDEILDEWRVDLGEIALGANAVDQRVCPDSSAVGRGCKGKTEFSIGKVESLKTASWD